MAKTKERSGSPSGAGFEWTAVASSTSKICSFCRKNQAQFSTIGACVGGGSDIRFTLGCDYCADVDCQRKARRGFQFKLIKFLSHEVQVVYVEAEVTPSSKICTFCGIHRARFIAVGGRMSGSSGILLTVACDFCGDDACQLMATKFALGKFTSLRSLLP